MSQAGYVRSLPNGLRAHFEQHFASGSDLQAEAARRLVSHPAMQDAYPSLVKLLGDDPGAHVYQLGAWFQMASSCALIVKSDLRAKRNRTKELARQAIETAIELNGLIAEAKAVPEFWPAGLNIGTLLENAIDDRGSGIALAPTGVSGAPLPNADELKRALSLLHSGDERYFPTFPELINQFASALEIALASGTIDLTGYSSTDAGLKSRKENEHVSYLVTFCEEWDAAAKCSSVPTRHPAYAVLAAQTTAALDLPDDPDNSLDAQTVAVYLRDYRKRCNT